ncbi:MAG: hypothetical protein QXK45_02765 [Thermofilaceae archaeon]
MRVVILNSFVARPGLCALVEEASFEEARTAAAVGASSFVGHPATAALLGVAVNRGEYVPAPGDVAYVLRLRRRLQAPGDVAVRPEDLEVLRVKYAKDPTTIKKMVGKSLEDLAADGGLVPEGVDFSQWYLLGAVAKTQRYLKKPPLRARVKARVRSLLVKARTRLY